MWVGVGSTFTCISQQTINSTLIIAQNVGNACEKLSHGTSTDLLLSFFLSGLRWHLFYHYFWGLGCGWVGLGLMIYFLDSGRRNGLSELPLKNAFFYYLKVSLFHFHYRCVLEEPYFPTHSCAFVGLFFVPCTSMLSSTVLQHRKHDAAQHSTAQHSTISLHKAALQPSADQSAKPLGSRQRWREPAHIVEHIYSALISQNERRIRTLPGLQNFTTTHTALM